MAITSILRNFVGNPNLVTIITSDNLAAITASGYITSEQVNIDLLNNGVFQWADTDLMVIQYATAQWGLFSRDATTDTFVAIVLTITKVAAVEASNAVTINSQAGVITTSALTTAAGASYVITLTNSSLLAASVVTLAFQGGTNTRKNYNVEVVPSAGSAVITIYNTEPSNALNGTMKLGFLVS